MHPESAPPTAMPTLVRLFQIMRNGARAQRVQAWLGLAFLIAALVWFILNIVKILLLVGGLFAGFVLLARALRPPPEAAPASSTPPPSPSS